VLRNCGWVEILNERDRTVLARGCALLRQLPSSDNGDWRGDLSPLRLIGGARSLEPGTYVMRFERSGEELLVELRQHGAAIGTFTSAAVRAAERGLPAALTDRHGGE
jgi:hypothetical protein